MALRSTRVLIACCIISGMLVYALLLLAANDQFHSINDFFTHENQPPLPCPSPQLNSTVRTPHIKEIHISPRDIDTTANWQDDDGNLRYAIVAIKPSTEDLQYLRTLVGSIHDYENETNHITVFGFKVNTDFYEEICTYSYVRFVDIPVFSGDDNNNTIIEKAFSMAKDLYSFVLLFTPDAKMMLQRGGLASAIKTFPAGPIKVLFNGTHSDVVRGHVRNTSSLSSNITAETVLDGDKYLNTTLNLDHGRCTLTRNLTSPFRIRLIYAKDNINFIAKEDNRSPNSKLVCLAIASYSGGATNVSDFSLIKQVLPTYLNSTSGIGIDGPESRYRYAIYLGIQRDVFYDNKERMEQVINTIEAANKNRSFSLRIFYTPLNAPSVDITYKWNVLIDQSYRDGCDYIYQYSDDTEFTTPWVEQFIGFLEAQSNFGIAGAIDATNTKRMTLSFAHRSHINIFGSYWPMRMKNAWSDNWHQYVYGQRYTKHLGDVRIRNTAKQGTRYPACFAHKFLWKKIMIEESRPHILEWLKLQYHTYDVLEKIAYFSAGCEESTNTTYL